MDTNFTENDHIKDELESEGPDARSHREQGRTPGRCRIEVVKEDEIQEVQGRKMHGGENQGNDSGKQRRK